METIITITTGGQGSPVVSARELHTFLEVKSKFASWITNRIKDFGFTENRDYTTFSKNLENGGRSTEYALTLNMAKELSMVERNEKGRQARQYFIHCEETLRDVASQSVPALPTDPALLQLLSQQTQLLANQQELLDQLRAEVKQIQQSGHKLPPTKPRPGQQLPLPGIAAPARSARQRPNRENEPSLRQLINQQVDYYCDRFGYDRHQTWTYLYRRIFEVYGIDTRRLLRAPGQNTLDALERYHHLRELHALVSAELSRLDQP